MSLETGTYISDLVSTNPTSTDPKSQGDDHIRLIKSLIKATFANITGAVTVTHTQLNTVIDRVLRAGDIMTGTHDFTGAAVTVAAPSAGSNPVTKTYADALAFSATLPGQTGNANKVPRTNGSVTSWEVPRLQYEVERGIRATRRYNAGM